MKIAFIDNNPNINKGSYRIHVHDLSYYFNKIGYESKINPSDLNNYDIVIHGKTKKPKFIQNKINGIITPDKENIKILKKFNFIIVGSINLPIIKFSVDWWNTLHQPASISRLSSPSIDPSMLQPLIIMTLAFFLIGLFIASIRIRSEILERKYLV